MKGRQLFLLVCLSGVFTASGLAQSETDERKFNRRLGGKVSHLLPSEPRLEAREPQVRHFIKDEERAQKLIDVSLKQLSDDELQDLYEAKLSRYRKPNAFESELGESEDGPIEIAEPARKRGQPAAAKPKPQDDDEWTMLFSVLGCFTFAFVVLYRLKSS